MGKKVVSDKAETASAPLPLTETVTPASADELVARVAQCFVTDTPVYPIGGGTSLDWGLPARRPGIGLSLAGLTRVVDYPARDMTITVEVGMTWQTLSETLASENQQLPIDVPQPARATVGGVIATGFNGPRRYGCGTIRDHVIGISAVDGRGTPFKGGGRVVKNVAGYDFCKLLTGSLGTLGVLTQVTLRLKPRPPRSVLVSCTVDDLSMADRLLAALAQSETNPVAIELLGGPAWQQNAASAPGGVDAADRLMVGLEGTDAEVSWMIEQLEREWRAVGAASPTVYRDAEAGGWWRRLAEFPQAAAAPLVLKASVTPSGTTAFVSAVRALDPQASIQAHAGNGIVIVRLSQIPAEGLSRTLISRLQPVAAASHGHVTVWSNPGGVEVTHQSVWGGTGLPFDVMTSVKRQFDPKDLLNPGRFVYV